MIQKMKDELHQAKTDYRARMKDDPAVLAAMQQLGEHLFELFDKGASVTTLCEYVGTKNRRTVTEWMESTGRLVPRGVHRKSHTGVTVVPPIQTATDPDNTAATDPDTDPRADYWSKTVREHALKNQDGTLLDVQDVPPWAWSPKNPAAPKNPWSGFARWGNDGLLLEGTQPNPLQGEYVTHNRAVRGLFE